MSEITYQNILPMCIRCKDRVSNFHGFGEDLCWPCYSAFILSFQMEMVGKSSTQDTSPQFFLDFSSGK